MSSVYPRPELGRQMATQLLRPGPLDASLQSGLFLSGQRRTGKTTFLQHDLIPALEAMGALVIYVDLWSDVQASPSSLVHAAIKQALTELQNQGSRMRRTLARVKGAEVGALGFKFGFSLDSLGKEDGTTLAQAIGAIVEQAQTDVVLIIDEVQHAITSENGHGLLLALKAARDAINQNPQSQGRFYFVGTGSHRAMVNELTARRNQAFAGAVSVPFPLLGRDYVEHLLQHAADGGLGPQMPSPEVAWHGFQTLGQRPEEMLRALRQQLVALQEQPQLKPDEVFPVVASTLRNALAGEELRRLESLGGLAEAIFARIAATEAGESKGLFTPDALTAYGEHLHRPVRMEEVQPTINAMLDENIVLRKAHGLYAITDPFVHQAWKESRAVQGRLPT